MKYKVGDRPTVKNWKELTRECEIRKDARYCTVNGDERMSILRPDSLVFTSGMKDFCGKPLQ